MFRIATALVLLLPATTVLAASFDCARAGTLVEHTVCNDPELSDLDVKMATAYRGALARSSDAGALQSGQRRWLSEVRNVCESPACLKTAYEVRIVSLSQLAQDEKTPSSEGTGIKDADERKKSRAAEASRSRAEERTTSCEKILGAGIYNLTLEKLCGFEGNVARATRGLFDASNCGDVVPSARRDEIIADVAADTLPRLEHFGEEVFCRENLGPYMDLIEGLTEYGAAPWPQTAPPPEAEPMRFSDGNGAMTVEVLDLLVGEEAARAGKIHDFELEDATKQERIPIYFEVQVRNNNVGNEVSVHYGNFTLVSRSGETFRSGQTRDYLSTGLHRGRFGRGGVVFYVYPDTVMGSLEFNPGLIDTRTRERLISRWAFSD